jgi:hypothetical protein
MVSLTHGKEAKRLGLTVSLSLPHKHTHSHSITLVLTPLTELSVVSFSEIEFPGSFLSFFFSFFFIFFIFFILILWYTFLLLCVIWMAVRNGRFCCPRFCDALSDLISVPFPNFFIHV